MMIVSKRNVSLSFDVYVFGILGSLPSTYSEWLTTLLPLQTLYKGIYM